MILEDLTEALTSPAPTIPSVPYGKELNDAILQLQLLMCCNKNEKQLDQPSINEPPRLLPIRVTGPVTQLQMCCPVLVGIIVCRKFNDGNFYEGEVTSYNVIKKFYTVKYLDGDTKDYDHDKICLYKKSNQRYSTPNKSAYYMFANKYSENIFFILTKAAPNTIKHDYHQQRSSILLKHKLAEPMSLSAYNMVSSIARA